MAGGGGHGGWGWASFRIRDMGYLAGLGGHLVRLRQGGQGGLRLATESATDLATVVPMANGSAGLGCLWWCPRRGVYRARASGRRYSLGMVLTGISGYTSRALCGCLWSKHINLQRPTRDGADELNELFAFTFTCNCHNIVRCAAVAGVPLPFGHSLGDHDAGVAQNQAGKGRTTAWSIFCIGNVEVHYANAEGVWGVPGCSCAHVELAWS